MTSKSYNNEKVLYGKKGYVQSKRMFPEPLRFLSNCCKLPDASVTALMLVTWKTSISPDQFVSWEWPKLYD